MKRREFEEVIGAEEKEEEEVLRDLSQVYASEVGARAEEGSVTKKNQATEKVDP